MGEAGKSRRFGAYHRGRTPEIEPETLFGVLRPFTAFAVEPVVAIRKPPPGQQEHADDLLIVFVFLDTKAHIRGLRGRTGLLFLLPTCSRKGPCGGIKLTWRVYVPKNLAEVGLMGS